MAKGLNHNTTGEADDNDLIELIELDTADRFDISTHFPLVQAHDFDAELEESSNVDIRDVNGGAGDRNDDNDDADEERLVDLSSALGLLETPEKNDFSFMGAEDDTDHLHLVTYHNSNRSSVGGAEADVNVDAVSLLMPELGTATGLDCGNYVDYDEFDMCLNNILSENDDELDDGNNVINVDASLNSGKHHHQQNHHQQWRDVGDVLSLVPLTNNNLGLSFQEFATESSVTDDLSASSSSSQLA